VAEFGGERLAGPWDGEAPIFLRLVWAEDKNTGLSIPDVANALWNVELLYDFAVLLMHPAYQEFDLAHNFWASGVSAINDRHRLQVVAVDHHSPLAFIALIPIAAAGAGGIWAITQTFDKIANFRLNRKKLKADVRKAEADARRANADADKAEYQRNLARRRAQGTADELRKRIETAPLKLAQGELADERPAA
jgi:hypothetical protein